MLILPIVLFFAIGAQSQCITDNDGDVPKKSTTEALYKGQLNFTLSVFNSINKIQPNRNVFFSPFSIYHSLLLAYFSSGGETEASVKRALKLDPDESKVAIMKSYVLEEFLRKSRPPEDYEFNSVNKVFIETTLPVRDCMLSFFKDEIEKMDFKTNALTARDYINEWVSNHTKNNIKDLLPVDAVDFTTKMVLTNAAYFKGVWASRFDVNNTKKHAFFIAPNKQTIIDMMTQTGRFNYGVSEKLGCYILEMPYKGNNVSMFVLLPPFAALEEGIDKILSQLSPSTLAQIVEEDALVMRQIEVAFPKFTIEKTLPLREVFGLMELDELFSDTSDFSTLTGEVGPNFSDATHKAKIRVDESGTVAAAATAILSFRSSRPLEPSKFICDHPFVYFLFDKPSQTITFMGVYRNPKDLS